MTTTLAGASARSIVDRYLQEVVTGVGPTESEEVVSNEVLRQRTTAIRAAFPDLSLNIRQVLADDELVAVHATASGTHTGTFQGVPPTGRHWSAGYTAILRIADGRIADFWETWDLLSILEQLGAVRRVEGVSA